TCAMENVSVAVVGYGYWGPNLVRNFHEMPGAVLAAVADSDSERLARALKCYPAIRGHASIQDLLVSPGIDAVAIATPAPSHFGLGMACLQAGKHVFL